MTHSRHLSSNSYRSRAVRCHAVRRYRPLRVEPLERRTVLAATLVYGDFDGDGHQDLAIGSPNEDVGNIKDAGAVNVVYGSQGGLLAEGNQIWTQDSPNIAGAPEEGDFFGFALAAGDFDSDGFDDLAIGVPRDDLGGLIDVGAVNVLLGSPVGLSWVGNQILHQDVIGVQGQAERFDGFGSALATGHFNADAYADLAIGVPNESLGSVRDAGAVHVLYGSIIGLSVSDDQLLDEGRLRSLDDVDVGSYDHFGHSLAVGDFDGDDLDDLVVGVPDEDLPMPIDRVVADIGAFHLYSGGTTQLTHGGDSSYWHPLRPAFDPDPSTPTLAAFAYFGTSFAVGDFNGDGSSDLAVGMPGATWLQSSTAVRNAGAVQVLTDVRRGATSTAAGSTLYMQSLLTGDIRFTESEEGDFFGQTLAAGDFDGDGLDDLAIGVPFEDVTVPWLFDQTRQTGERHIDVSNREINEGELNVVYGSASPFGLSKAAQVLDLYNAIEVDTPGRAHVYFGAALAATAGNATADLAIGIPGWDIGSVESAGAANVMTGSPGRRLHADRSRLWSQAAGGIPGDPEHDDALGGFFDPYPFGISSFWDIERGYSSRPNADQHLFLEFGESFTSVESFDTDADFAEKPKFNVDGHSASYFNQTEWALMRDIWYAVAEDFAPFGINVTTTSPGPLANGVAAGIAIGGSWRDWYKESAGGVAKIGGFTNDHSNWAYAFTEFGDNRALNTSWVSDTISHEAGHLFGLQHKGDVQNGLLVNEYSVGVDDWRPIMGSGGQRSVWTQPLIVHNELRNTDLPGPVNIVAHSDGETLQQNDLTVLSNVLGAVPDDNTGALHLGSLYQNSSEHFAVTGLIETAGETDRFTFRLRNPGIVTVSVTTNEVNPNLNPLLTLTADDYFKAALPVDGNVSLVSSVLRPWAEGDLFTIQVAGLIATFGDIGAYTLRVGFTPTVPQWAEAVPIPTSPGEYELNVYGTEWSDRLRIWVDALGQLAINDTPSNQLVPIYFNGAQRTNFRPEDFARINMYLRDANDEVTIEDTYLPTPINVYGEGGQDTLLVEFGENGAARHHRMQFVGEVVTVSGSAERTSLLSADTNAHLTVGNATLTLHQTVRIRDDVETPIRVWRSAGSPDELDFYSERPVFEPADIYWLDDHVRGLRYRMTSPTLRMNVFTSTGPDDLEIYSIGDRFTADLTFHTGRGADQITVHRAMTEDSPYVLTIDAGAENDTVTFENLISSPRGILTARGGEGEDTLVVSDSGRFSSTSEYQVTSTSSQGFHDGAHQYTAHFADFDHVTLIANDQDNTIAVDGTAEGVQLRIEGSDGRDTFEVSAEGLMSDIEIVGGDPGETPGDTLLVTGNPEIGFAPQAVLVGQDRWIQVDDHQIFHSGIESTSAENFDLLVYRTPRSRDLVTVRPVLDGFISIEGVSGAQPMPLPYFSFRSIRRMTFDAASADSIPEFFQGQQISPIPHDNVTILPGVFDDSRLERISLLTGAGGNLVHDHTLEGSATSLGELNVDGLGGFTHVVINGTSAQADFEQIAGLQTVLRAFNSAGEIVRRVNLNAVGEVTLPDRWDNVRALGENVDRIFSGTTRQTVSGAGLTPVSVAPGLVDSRLEIVALGDSQIDFSGILFTEGVISGLRDAGPQPEPPVSPDSISVRPRFAGPQPEPPRMRIVGFGAEDEIVIEGLRQPDGSTLPTDFRWSVDDDGLDTIGLADVGSTTRIRFDVEAVESHGGPRLGFVGDAALYNTFTATRPEPNGTVEVRQVTAFTRGIADVVWSGSTSNEIATLTTQPDGGAIGVWQSADADPLGEYVAQLVLDSSAGTVTLVGGGGVDRADVFYPEPDFRNLTIGTQAVEHVGFRPAVAGLPELVAQTLTPSVGEISSGNLLLTHDDFLAHAFIEGSTLDVRVTRDPMRSSFDRDLSLSYRHLGSEGKYVIEDAEFAGELDMTIAHNDITTNLTTIQEKDVVYHEKVTIKVVGAEEGEDEVLVTKAGVEAKAGSKFEADVKTGDDLVVVTTTDSGQAADTKDEILVTGTGDATTESTKAILVHKKRAAAPGEQLDDLKLEKPQYAARIETLKTKADPSLLAEKGTPKIDSGHTTVDYKGEATNIHVFVKNVAPKTMETSVKNSDGTTAIEKVGRVVVTVPDLVGTEIDPTQPFATFAVVNTLDAGKGSLRAAIDAANAWTGAGLAVVTFAIRASDPGFVDADSHLTGGDADPDGFVISPLMALPVVTRGNVVINGQSQQAATGDTNPLGPEIVLAGNLAGADANGLHLASSSNHIHGLNIQQFHGNGVLIEDNDNTLTGNYIGTLATGTSIHSGPNNPTGNLGDGVRVVDSSGNLIGGATEAARNIISGNNTGVSIIGALAGHNHVAGNYIGVAADGQTPLGNGQGVTVVGTAAGNVIGGITEGERNVISASARNNVLIGGTMGTTVQGNYIGTDASGQHATTYARAGIRVDDDHGSLIGGTQDGAGNVLSGNFYGIYVTGRWVEGGTQGLRIEGNRVGTTADGQGAIANFQGIYVDGFDSPDLQLEAHDVTIGGVAPNAGNLVAANQNGGIIVRGPNLTGIRVVGNKIGTNRGGTAALPNGINRVGDAGLRLDTVSGVVVGGNLISGNAGSGVFVVGGGNHLLAGNLIGLAADGTTPLGNAGGINILNSSGNVIGGDGEPDRNVIAASTGGYGVAIQGLASTDNLVQGNYVGTDTSGTLDRGHHFSGVLVQDTTGNTLRGNVLSGNGNHGVYVLGIASTDVTNLIEDNYIGTDVSGRRDLGNTLMGIRVLYSGPAGMMTAGPVIRGNLISGNDHSGVTVDSNAREVLIEDNLIGTDDTGTARLLDPQGLPGLGVYLVGRDNHVIGNVISGNPLDGINIDGTDVPDGRASGNVVQGNLIGVGLDGVTPLGNGRNGIVIRRGAGGNWIGTLGTDPRLHTEGNVIAYNAASGVGVSEVATGNSIRGNSIHSNALLGIDLAPVGPTANDELDFDAGPNDLQNAPELRSAIVGSATRVAGQLRSTPAATFTIDVYASAAADLSGFGEGARWLGQHVVTTNAAGVANFSIEVAGAVRDEFLTATATNASGSTSEFSAALVARGRPSGHVELAAHVVDSALASIATFDLSMAETGSNVPATTRGLKESREPDNRSEASIHSRWLPHRMRDLYRVDEFVPKEDEFDSEALFADLDENFMLAWGTAAPGRRT